MRYAKISYVVEAIQNDGLRDTWNEKIWPWFLKNGGRNHKCSFFLTDQGCICIGEALVGPGDWVVIEDGRFSPCTADVFRERYISA